MNNKRWIWSAYLSNKADLKRVTGVDTSNLVAKSDLASLKSEVDKSDADKLKAFLMI